MNSALLTCRQLIALVLTAWVARVQARAWREDYTGHTVRLVT
ncbi:hypothetical protein Q31a_40670 [Aureliella helgolandensis]|uniref:Uncharacterized protein n=1 Tax=Aureliella helgolandensis TaxID=2527968 RepID=A0A518GB26_9BACT|nr:hypothetical protein Q31a_40670 [Aureliella helgolandensis]